MLKKYLFIISLFFLLAVAVFGLGANTVEAGPNDNVRGWWWSDNIGWISLNNCSSVGVCTGQNYGVHYNYATGVFSGWAWSDNIGWIAFTPSTLGNVAQCGGPCRAYTDVTRSAIHGWVRACAGTASGGVCGTTSSRTDGWDGWISLSGAGYGMTRQPDGQQYRGYAWGDDVVGWISAVEMSMYRRLTVNKSGNGTGSVTGPGVSCTTTCTTSNTLHEHSNTPITLTATPDEGAKFEGWGGECASAGTAPTCQIAMNVDRVVTASFSYATLTAEISAGSGIVRSEKLGKVTNLPINCPNVCSQLFGWYDTVRLFAEGNPGWRVDQWLGTNCQSPSGGGQTYCDVYMNANKTAIVRFVPIIGGSAYTLTVTKSGNGAGTVTAPGVSPQPDISCGITCSSTYPTGSNVILSHVPAVGSSFVRWTVDGSASVCPGTGTCTVTMNAAHLVNAEFTICLGPCGPTAVSSVVSVRRCTAVDGECPSSDPFVDADTEAAALVVPPGEWYEIRYRGTGTFPRCEGDVDLAGVDDCGGSKYYMAKATNKHYRLTVTSGSLSAMNSGHIRSTAGTLGGYCYATDNPSLLPPTMNNGKYEGTILVRGLRLPIYWVVEAWGGNPNTGPYQFRWTGTDIGTTVTAPGGIQAMNYPLNNGYGTVGMKSMTVEITKPGSGTVTTDCVNDVNVRAQPIYEEF